MTDPFRLLEDRRSEIASELDNLSRRVAVLKNELSQIDSARELLARLSKENKEVRTKELHDALDESVVSGKPPGTPPMTDMIMEALEQAHRKGMGGMPPSGLVSYVRAKYWPAAEVANVGPIAWRMERRGQIGKTGATYFRLDREELYPMTLRPVNEQDEDLDELM
jgi:hypothetical protein